MEDEELFTEVKRSDMNRMCMVLRHGVGLQHLMLHLVLHLTVMFQPYCLVRTVLGPQDGSNKTILKKYLDLF